MKSWWFNKERLLERDGYDAVNFRGKDASQARALINRIRQEGFQVQSLGMFIEIANRIVMVVTIALSLIGGVALLVASIGIANTMIMSVHERTREIGIFKALGASSSDVHRLFMLEAAFIGLAGGLAGLSVGWVLGAGLNLGISWYLVYRRMNARDSFFFVTPELALGVVVFALLIGVVAGLVPARKAAALDPIDALRYE